MVTEKRHRLTKHTRCGSESNWKFSLPCTEIGLELQASAVPSFDWKSLSHSTCSGMGLFARWNSLRSLRVCLTLCNIFTPQRTDNLSKTYYYIISYFGEKKNKYLIWQFFLLKYVVFWNTSDINGKNARTTGKTQKFMWAF